MNVGIHHGCWQGIAGQQGGTEVDGQWGIAWWSLVVAWQSPRKRLGKGYHVDGVILQGVCTPAVGRQLEKVLTPILEEVFLLCLGNVLLFQEHDGILLTDSMPWVEMAGTSWCRVNA